MFETLPTPKLDGIIGLMQAFAADTRTDKIDLGVGVYRDAEGRTPVMRAVKQAEARILDTQDSKSYLSLAGDAAFLTEMETLLLGGAVPSARVAAVGTPGGTSAVRQICEFDRQGAPRRDRLGQCADMAEPRAVDRSGWPDRTPLSVSGCRSRGLGPRRGDDDRSGASTGRRSRAAAWLLPQPDRRGPIGARLGRGCSTSRAQRGHAVCGHGLSGLWRRAGCRCRRVAPLGRALARGVDRGELFKEFRPVS